MTNITIKVPDDTAKTIAFFLRKKYNTTETNLNKLAEMAIQIEVAKSAKEILGVTEGNIEKTIQNLNKKED